MTASTKTAAAAASTAVAAELSDLADVLEALPDEAWNHLSLCEGWRVREVVAHMTMPVRYRLPRLLFELVQARGNFHRMADRSARKDGSLPVPRMLAELRSAKLSTWQPPGGGFEGALIHAVVHGLDITVALGVDRQVPDHRMRLVLAGVTSARSLKHFGTDLRGFELRATDLDWTYGTGTPLSGTAQNLGLLLCGRRLPAGHLQGDLSDRFTS